MRYSLVFALLTFVGCSVSETARRTEPREVCGNGLDDDGDGHLDSADQDCWLADVGTPPVVADSGSSPPVDAGSSPSLPDAGTPPVGGCATGTINVRLYWRSDLDLRYAHIQGCRGERCVVERFVGMDGECSSATGTVVCRLANVPIGTRLDFNGYGELVETVEGREDVRQVWGVGLRNGAEYQTGAYFVSVDRNCDAVWDVDRTGAVRIVGITEGGGRNWSYVVGR